MPTYHLLIYPKGTFVQHSHLINAARSGAEKTQQALREFEAAMDRIGVSCGHDHATSAEACDCAQNR
jgi:hypothetical protein